MTQTTSYRDDGRSDSTIKVLKPWVVDCGCGATLKLAFNWDVFKCSKCGRVTDLR